MSDSVDKHLRSRLGTLGTEIFHVRLPGPDAARRRGRQRIRNQLTGTVLAGTVVAAVGVFGVLPPLIPADDRHVAQADMTRTATPEVYGYAPDSDRLLDLAENPLLTDNDVNPVGDYSGFTMADGSTLDGEWFSYRCLRDLRDAGAEPFLTGEWFHEGEGNVAELILRLPDETLAERIVTDHTILPPQCGEVAADRDKSHTDPAYLDVAGAGEGLVWTIDDVPGPSNPGSSSSFTGVGLARSANVVVVISFGAMGDPTDGGWDAYAARTLSRALERATPSS